MEGLFIQRNEDTTATPPELGAAEGISRSEGPRAGGAGGLSPGTSEGTQPGRKWPPVTAQQREGGRYGPRGLIPCSRPFSPKGSQRAGLVSQDRRASHRGRADAPEVEKGQRCRYWTRNRRDRSTHTLSYVKEGSQALSRYEYKQGNTEPLAKPRPPLSPSGAAVMTRADSPSPQQG